MVDHIVGLVEERAAQIDAETAVLEAAASAAQ
jgi:hypothetical protein